MPHPAVSPEVGADLQHGLVGECGAVGAGDLGDGDLGRDAAVGERHRGRTVIIVDLAVVLILDLLAGREAGDDDLAGLLVHGDLRREEEVVSHRDGFAAEGGFNRQVSQQLGHWFLLSGIENRAVKVTTGSVER